MKRTLHQLFCLLMASVVLVTSTGFGLIEHACKVRGKQVQLASFRKETSCKGCPSGMHHRSENHQTVIKKSDCCQAEQRYENVSFTSSISQLIAKFIKSVTDTALAGLSHVVEWLFAQLLPSRSATIALTVDPPSLLSGRELLAFVQRFLL